MSSRKRRIPWRSLGAPWLLLIIGRHHIGEKSRSHLVARQVRTPLVRAARFHANGASKVLSRPSAGQPSALAKRSLASTAADLVRQDCVSGELGESALDAQLRAFVSAVFPRAKDKSHKQLLASRIEQIAQSQLGSDVKILCTGSAVNGFGEADSELDVVIYVPVSASRAEQMDSGAKMYRSKCLQDVVVECKANGFHLNGPRTSFHVPFARLEERVDVRSPDDTAWQTCALNVVNIRCQNLIPLYSTQLLRAYASVDARLPAVVIAVKRWARAVGIARAVGGFVSSYGLTLMAVYFFQVCHGLPSLHRMAFSQSVDGGIAAYADGSFDISFLNVVEQVANQRPMQCESAPHAQRNSYAAVLVGFFDFFSSVFRWNTEVVSVRLGFRTDVDDAQLSRLQCKATYTGINIEDPIEISRNVNFVTCAEHAQELRNALLNASAILHSGGGLAKLISPEDPVVPWADPSVEWSDEGYLDLSVNEIPQSCSCHVCGQQFVGRTLLMQHQVDRGHYNACSGSDLERLRASDASGVESAMMRLQAVLDSD